MTSDPPYGDVAKSNWELSGEKATLAVYHAILTEAEKELAPGGALLIWGGIGSVGNRAFLRFLYEAERDSAFYLKNLITWSKKRAYGKKDDYLFTREELAWFQRKGEEKEYVFNIPLLDVKRGYPGYNPKYPAKSEFKRRTNTWTDITEIMRGKIHECEKPLELYKVIYETHSNPGDYVLDVCGGSGVAAEAALAIGRKPIIVESDESVYKLICNRLEFGRETLPPYNADESDSESCAPKKLNCKRCGSICLCDDTPEEIAP